MKNYMSYGFKLIAVSSFVFGGLFTSVYKVGAATAPTLGAAAGYSAFGKAGVTNTVPSTHLWGNVGADLTANITNLLSGPGGQVDGVIDTGAGVEAGILSAYAQLDAQPATGALNLAGIQTVGPGVYTVGAGTLNGNLTLSGSGVYIFRSSSSISADPGAQVTLTNGAKACNVFWQVPGAVTIGSNAHIEGTILTNTQLISLGTGATLKGRALSRIAQVTLDNNQITEPVCSLPQITVTKIVVGGTKVVSDFPLFINGSSVTSGVATTTSAGLYTITETSDPSYTSSISGDCALNGNINLFLGDIKNCTITNTFVPPVPVAPYPSSHSQDTPTIITSNNATVTNSPTITSTSTTVSINVASTSPIVIGEVLGASTSNTPSLPNAGFPPYEKNFSFEILTLVTGVVVLMGTSLSFILKKA